MTHQELQALMDKRATLSYGDGIEWPVTILDARQAYGRTDLLVRPRKGFLEGDTRDRWDDLGQTWVSAERVKVRG